MCANYRPSSKEVIEKKYGITASADYLASVWPADFAPILVRHRQTGELVLELARFGLLPNFAKDTKFCRNTYNARSETVAEKPSFKNAWNKGHFCLVPVHSFNEPCYESGKAVPWSIGMIDDQDYAIAGMWSWWKNPATSLGEASFTMLTLNADAHSFMQRFHKPGDEKRMPYIVKPEEYDIWLGATPDEAREMIEPFQPELMRAEPAAAKREEA